MPAVSMQACSLRTSLGVALVISAAAAAAAPAFAPTAALRRGLRASAGSALLPQLRGSLPALSSSSLGQGKDRRVLGEPRLGRAGRLQVGGVLGMVASEGGEEAKVWEEKVETGEHGFKRVVMEVEVGGTMLRLETGPHTYKQT